MKTKRTRSVKEPQTAYAVGNSAMREIRKLNLAAKRALNKKSKEYKRAIARNREAFKRLSDL